ncbi:MAG: type 4a pilus biogenesis protein PilO [Candidatus Kerfeldbacteria bacterium]|nr:type 4a pilus biogenesis protein PilO [Candidatus Kerfeldbacteria bacterium]
MKSFPLGLTVALVGLIVLSTGVVFTVLPQLVTINQVRGDIDSTRLTIASLRLQQTNIENVRQQFASLQAQEQKVLKQYVLDAASIDFFNLIDDLYARAGVTNGQLRIDTPTTNADYQLLGAHLTFSASYQQLVSFIRSLNTIEPLVRIQTLTVNSGTDALPVTIDAFVSWRKK